MSQAIRRVMTWVLPVPAPATTSSGPVAVGHRPQLVGIEAAEQRLEAGGGSVAERRRHDRDELAPGRQLVERRGLAAASRTRGRVTGSRSGRRERSVRGGHVGTIADRRDT